MWFGAGVVRPEQGVTVSCCGEPYLTGGFAGGGHDSATDRDVVDATAGAGPSCNSVQTDVESTVLRQVSNKFTYLIHLKGSVSDVFQTIACSEDV